MKATTAIHDRACVKPQEHRVPSWVMPLVVAATVAADALLAAGGFLAAFSIRQGEPIFSQTAWAWSKEFVAYAGILYFAMPIRVAMLWYHRAYRFQGAFSYTQEAIKVFKAAALGSLLIVSWAFLFRGGFAFREFSYSRGVFILDFLLALAILMAFHLGLRWIQAAIRMRGINLLPTLVVGTNAEALRTIAELTEQQQMGYRVIAAIDPGDRQDAALENFTAASGIPIVGGIDDLASVVRDLEIQEIIITDNDVPSELLFESMLQIGRSHRVEFRFAPGLFDLLPQKTSVEQIGVLPMVRLFREPLSDAQRFVKRLSDIVLSLLAAAVLAPVWVITAVMIRLDSKGPILFKQERVGMDGRIFLCYKFRTMIADADEELHREAYQKNIVGSPEANSGEDDIPVFGKVKDDPRITKFGRRLRRSSLDELPQLLNVLKGDMSIVGPRPPIPYEVEEYDLPHRKRLDMKPGITGLWQVSGRNRLTFAEMVKLDLYYIENWSIWLDLKIILLTLPAVFRGDGAR